MTAAGVDRAPNLARPGDPPGYEIQREALAALSEAQRRWREETGARLEVLPGPPYFRYSREHIPRPERTGETVRERPVRDEAGRVVARRLIRERPDGTVSEEVHPIETERSPTKKAAS
jgi:hypothetical protein